jgi:hypothetical protein
MDDPATLRAYAALFEAVLTAARAPRSQADEIERQRGVVDDHTPANARNGAERLR